MIQDSEKKILLFGGTSEGRELSGCLSRNRVYHTVCVATEYGEEVLNHSGFSDIRRGRLGVPEMEALMREAAYAAVVDATHPYAVEVSKNIREACLAAGMRYLRYLRPSGEAGEEGCAHPACTEGTARSSAAAAARRVWVNSAAEAADYLEQQRGTIFLTTGSKELHVFADRITDKSRLFARVLPSAQVVAACRELGLEGKQICAMQGPFSEEMNCAMLRQARAEFLVTKDTGAAGGFPEKERAAEALGVKMVIIRRPEEAGMDRKAVLDALGAILGRELYRNDDSSGSGNEEAGIAEQEHAADGQTSGIPREISCVGIGMGTLETLTHEGAAAIRKAEIVFGAGRLLDSVRRMNLNGYPKDRAEELAGIPELCQNPNLPVQRPVWVAEYDGRKIAAYLAEHPQYRRIAVLMSGDVGFYSGARGIQEAFAGEQVRYYCGISSVVYFASRIPTAWQDAKLLSAHGRQIHLLNSVQRCPKIILLVSGAEDVRRICRTLFEAGMTSLRVTVGTNLSYPDEQMKAGVPEDFLNFSTAGLSIMMLENPDAAHIVTPGIPDDAFVRGKVPMTKEEVRILSVAKLRLHEDSVVYDVGAGTGSVSVECARLCTAGTVYAVERNPDGIALIQENAVRMHLSNVIPVEGTAPAALEGLPAPTHAFIGGSSGNMAEIIETLRRKNPSVRVVINTIALESIAEVTGILKSLAIADADIAQVSAAKSRTLGRYHMMTGLNPVYIISFGGKDESR